MDVVGGLYDVGTGLTGVINSTVDSLLGHNFIGDLAAAIVTLVGAIPIIG